MKSLRTFSLVALTIIAIGFGQSAQAAITGQWDFGGSLAATIGVPIEYRDLTTGPLTVFTTSLIGGVPADVMNFPATDSAQGYIVTHGAAPNGGGAYVNKYTIVMDIMFPAGSSGVYRALWQTSTGNANDGDLFINPDNGIGISGDYDGQILADTWHRVAFAFDLSSSSVDKYIDGQPVGQQILSSGLDGRWSLDPVALLLTDEDGETAAGYINSLQIYDDTLTSDAILALGGPSAAGLPVPEPSTAALLCVGAGALAALFLARRNRR